MEFDMSKTPEGYAELIEAVSDETARDIIAYRKKIRKPLTARAARKIAKELAKVPEAERDDAVDTWFNRGWQGFEACWLIPKPFHSQKPQTGGAPRSFDNVYDMTKLTKYRPAFLQKYEAK
jgi:hypothetical protein